MPHFMIVLIPVINLLNLSWIKESVCFEEYGAFKRYFVTCMCFCLQGEDLQNRRCMLSLQKSYKISNWSGNVQIYHRSFKS